MTLENLLEQTVLHFTDCHFRSQKINRNLWWIGKCRQGGLCTIPLKRAMVQELEQCTGNAVWEDTLGWAEFMSLYSRSLPRALYLAEMLNPGFQAVFMLKSRSRARWMQKFDLKYFFHLSSLECFFNLSPRLFLSWARAVFFSSFQYCMKNIFSLLSFQSNLPDDVFENGTAATEKRPLSFTFGDLPYEDAVPPANSAESSSAHVSSSPDITATPTQHRALQSSQSSSLDCSSSDSRRDSVAEPKDLPSHGEGVVAENKNTPRAAPEVCQKIPDAGSNRVFVETSVPVSLLQDTDEGSELKPVELDTYEGNITKQLVKRLTSAETPLTPERLPCEGSISGESEGYKSYLDGSIEEALQGLLLALEPHKEQYKEFQDLDQEVMHLDDILKVSTFSENTTVKEIWACRISAPASQTSK